MAKTTTCAFCGKEVTTGFLKGDAMILSVGFHEVICCPHCYNQYMMKVDRIKKRLSVKLNNYAAATKTRKLESRFVANAIMLYLQEEAEQAARCGLIENYTDMIYYAVDSQRGYFAIREFEMGRDISTSQTVRNIKKAEDVGNVWFSKNDITRIEYATTFVGDVLDLFSTAYTFEIRLNDEKQITYKPCIARATFVGKGLFPHNQKKNAKKKCEEMLLMLKEAIGADVPVVYVKRFV